MGFAPDYLMETGATVQDNERPIDNASLAEEEEVWMLTLLHKQGLPMPMLGQKPSYADRARYFRQRDFTSMTRLRPSGIGTQYLPPRQNVRLVPNKMEQMASDMQELKDSAGHTNNTIEMLIWEMQEDRKLRSRSTRGQSLTSRQTQLPQCIAKLEHPADNAQSPTGAMPVEKQDQVDVVIQQLTESGELEVLTRLQWLEITHQTGGTDQLMQRRRGRGEDPAKYEVRISIAARACIIAKLGTGVSPADIFERLSPFRRQTRFEDTMNPQWLTGANVMPLHLNARTIREERAALPAQEQD